MNEYKCCLCKKDIDGSNAYEYRGFISCEDHFEQVIKKVDIRRSEIIQRNDHATKPLAGLDIDPKSAIGRANKELLSPAIETASRETLAEQQYRRGEL